MVVSQPGPVGPLAMQNVEEDNGTKQGDVIIQLHGMVVMAALGRR